MKYADDHNDTRLYVPTVRILKMHKKKLTLPSTYFSHISTAESVRDHEYDSWGFDD